MYAGVQPISVIKALKRTCKVHYYAIDEIPNIYGKIPPIVFKYPISPVELTRCVDHLQYFWCDDVMARKLAVILPNSSDEEGHIVEIGKRRSRFQG